MSKDERNYFQRKADSSNLDSNPGSRKRAANDDRGRDDLLPANTNPGVEFGELISVQFNSQERVQAVLRRIQNIDSYRAASVGYSSPYISFPIHHDRFICPFCGQDVRVVRWCKPQISSGRMNFDPETVVDANPNRPELD